jgi:hypothetical protein
MEFSQPGHPIAVGSLRSVPSLHGPVLASGAGQDHAVGSVGMANLEIAARLDTSPQVVHRWRNRFFERRLKGLEDGQRSCRPRVFPASVNAKVKALSGRWQGAAFRVRPHPRSGRLGGRG